MFLLRNLKYAKEVTFTKTKIYINRIGLSNKTREDLIVLYVSFIFAIIYID